MPSSSRASSSGALPRASRASCAASATRRRRRPRATKTTRCSAARRCRRALSVSIRPMWGLAVRGRVYNEPRATATVSSGIGQSHACLGVLRMSV
eukprot:1347627-Prymnesium_polylepis.1